MSIKFKKVSDFNRGILMNSRGTYEAKRIVF